MLFFDKIPCVKPIFINYNRKIGILAFAMFHKIKDCRLFETLIMEYNPA